MDVPDHPDHAVVETQGGYTMTVEMKHDNSLDWWEIVGPPSQRGDVLLRDVDTHLYVLRTKDVDRGKMSPVNFLLGVGWTAKALIGRNGWCVWNRDRQETWYVFAEAEIRILNRKDTPVMETAWIGLAHPAMALTSKPSKRLTKRRRKAVEAQSKTQKRRKRDAKKRRKKTAKRLQKDGARASRGHA
jgi:hypothetical protein